MINKKYFQILGNLGNKIEVKEVNKKNMFVFDIAVSEIFNKQKSTQWFNLVGFSNNKNYLDFLQTIEKGTLLLVQGSLSIKKGKKDIHTYDSISLICEEIEMLSNKKLINHKDNLDNNLSSNN